MTICQLRPDMIEALREQLVKISQQAASMVKAIDTQSCLLCETKNIKDLALELDSMTTYYHFQSSLLPHVEGLDEISKALSSLAEKRHGALIAVERNDSLEAFIQKCKVAGVVIEARVTASLLQTIFFPGNIMHDGAVIVRNGQIVTAGCVFPLSEQKVSKEGRKIGTRHRAALGLSEQCDALVIVVSEETGRVSFALNGQLFPIEVKLCESLEQHQIN